MPLLYEQEHPYVYHNDFRDIEHAQLWDNNLFDVDEIKDRLGSQTFATLYQQRPAPAEGNLIKTDWINYYDTLPETLDIIMQSWDIAIKDNKNADYTACTVWGKVGSSFYLIDIYRDKLEFPALLKQFNLVGLKHPKALKKLVEDKASGSPLIQTLKSKVSGIIPINPIGDKVSRFSAVTPLFEAGNVYLPNNHRLLDIYIQELLQFPNAKHDDLVDSTSQALNNFTNAKQTTFRTCNPGYCV